MGKGFNYSMLAGMLLLWAILQENYWADFRFLLSAVYMSVFLFGVFLLNPARDDHDFVLMWILAIVATLLFLLAWASDTIAYTFSAACFVLLSLLHLKKMSQTLLWRPWRDTFLVTTAFYLLLHFLTLDKLLPASPYYGIVIFTVYFGTTAVVWFYCRQVIPPLMVVYYLLLAIAVILALRRVSGQTEFSWYLIVLPVVAICFLAFVRYKCCMKTNGYQK